MKKNSTAGKKSTEPEDEDVKADGSKDKGDAEAEPNPESSSPTAAATTTAKKAAKPAAKTAETNEVGTDASIKDESDADEQIDDEKKSEIDIKPKTGYKSLQKSYIKLVCIHCNIKCVTFKVTKFNPKSRFVLSKKKSQNKQKKLGL